MAKYNRSILILGATGHVGGYATLYLKERGYNIIASGYRGSDNGFFAEHDIPYYSIDIKKQSDFEVLLENDIGLIIHAAGIMPSKMSGYNPQSYIDSIVSGTLNVLEFGRGKCIDKIIFTHSRADSNYLIGTKNKIASDIEKKFPLTGDHSIYSICKNAAVDMIEHYYYQFGIKRFIFRLPTIYSYHPNKYFNLNGKKILKAYRSIMEQAINGQDIEMWGDPSMEKEITYVNDLCQCFEKAIESKLDGGMYNVGRGIGVTLEEQIKGIVEVFCSNVKSQIISCPDKPNARQFVHDISKTQTELGYTPEYDYTRLLNEFKHEMEMNRFSKLWGREEDYN